MNALGLLAYSSIGEHRVIKKYIALRNFVTEVEKRGLVYGVSFSEYLIMRALMSGGSSGLKRVDLANQVHLSVSGITRALAPLEKAGYVARSTETDDARVRQVVLTPTGVALYADIEANVEQRMIEVEPFLAELLSALNAKN